MLNIRMSTVTVVVVRYRCLQGLVAAAAGGAHISCGEIKVYHQIRKYQTDTLKRHIVLIESGKRTFSSMGYVFIRYSFQPNRFFRSAGLISIFQNLKKKSKDRQNPTPKARSV